MMNTPHAIANKITLMQVTLYFACVPLLILSSKIAYLLIGWGIVLASDIGMLLVASFQAPSMAAFISSKIFKYAIFAFLIYISIKHQSFVWPQATWGVLLGQVVYMLACLLAGRRYA